MVVSTFGALQADCLRVLWLATASKQRDDAELAVGEVRQVARGPRPLDVRQAWFTKLCARLSLCAARTLARRYDAAYSPLSYLPPFSRPLHPAELLAVDLAGAHIGPVDGFGHFGG